MFHHPEWRSGSFAPDRRPTAVYRFDIKAADDARQFARRELSVTAPAMIMVVSGTIGGDVGSYIPGVVTGMLVCRLRITLLAKGFALANHRCRR